jgi:hypothetical protein
MDSQTQPALRPVKEKAGVKPETEQPGLVDNDIGWVVWLAEWL